MSSTTQRLARRDFFQSCAATCLVAGMPVVAAGLDPVPGSAGGSKIIDCHMHLKHGDAARTEWSADSIIEIMDQVGIGRAIVFAMSTTTIRSIEMARSAVEKYPKRLIPFLYALPSYERPVLKEIEDAISQRGFCGIKMHAGECTLVEYIVDPLMRMASSFAIPCLIDFAGNASAARRLAKSFPEVPMWLAHMGRYMSTDAQMVDQFISIAADHENVSLDLSGVALFNKVEEAISRVGAKRLVWGTDGPFKNPDVVTYARTELDKILTLKISDADKELILGGNVVRALKLTE